MQNVMSTAVIWSKSKPKVEFQYGGRLGEFNGMSSQSHVSHCRVLSPGEFNVMIPVPRAAPAPEYWNKGGHRQLSGGTRRARGARANNGSLGAEPPAGSRGRAPGQGVRGAKHP